MNRTNIVSLHCSRRAFLRDLSILGLGVGLSALLPVGLQAEPALRQWQGQTVDQVTFMDEALGNYPPYAAAMGFGRSHLFALNSTSMDPQLQLA